jgi:Fe-S-cluster containining protein
MTKTQLPLAVANAEAATFDCSFGRGCEGICCKNGRPSVGPDEVARIADNLPKFLPHLRPDARKLVEAEGFLSKRTKLGRPMVRVSESWCVFFNKGCVLHKVGAEDGDSFQYKPVQCSLFPLEKDAKDGDWYVRQWGYRGEDWDLFCLNPANSPREASESMAGEIALAATGAGDEAFTPAKPDAK